MHHIARFLMRLDYMKGSCLNVGEARRYKRINGYTAAELEIVCELVQEKLIFIIFVDFLLNIMVEKIVSVLLGFAFKL